MEISIEIRRKDIVAFNLYAFPRLRGTWIFFGMMSVGLFGYILLTKEPSDAGSVAIAAFAGLAGAAVGTIIALLFQLVTMLLTIGQNSGVLGVHHYRLSQQGLEERTDANETLQKWGAIQSIITTPNYILFRINSYLAHIIPRRSFATSAQFNSFYEQAISLRQADKFGRDALNV